MVILNNKEPEQCVTAVHGTVKDDTPPPEGSVVKRLLILCFRIAFFPFHIVVKFVKLVIIKPLKFMITAPIKLIKKVVKSLAEIAGIKTSKIVEEAAHIDPDITAIPRQGCALTSDIGKRGDKVLGDIGEIGKTGSLTEGE